MLYIDGVLRNRDAKKILAHLRNTISNLRCHQIYDSSLFNVPVRQNYCQNKLGQDVFYFLLRV